MVDGRCDGLRPVVPAAWSIEIGFLLRAPFRATCSGKAGGARSGSLRQHYLDQVLRVGGAPASPSQPSSPSAPAATGWKAGWLPRNRIHSRTLRRARQGTVRRRRCTGAHGQGASRRARLKNAQAPRSRPRKAPEKSRTRTTDEDEDEAEPAFSDRLLARERTPTNWRAHTSGYFQGLRYSRLSSAFA